MSHGGRRENCYFERLKSKKPKSSPGPKNVVGRLVAKVRYEQGISQPDLAAKCQILGWDISRDIIAGIEGHTREVADWEILILARALKTQVAAFLPEDFDLSQIPFPSQAYLENRRRNLARVKAKLRREKR